MSVQLSMLPMMMSEASLNAIGSRDLEAGAKPCVSPDGLTKNPSGQDHLLASHSAPQDSSVAAPMKGILPHTSPSSSPASDRPTSSESKSPARLSSESLQKALEERLQANLSGRGSTIYSGAWKLHTTPAGRRIYRLRASARRTSVSEHSSSEFGWPTPCASDNRDRGKWDDPAIQRRKEIGKSIELTMLVGVAGWPTPHLNSVTGAGSDGRAGGLNIQTAVELSGWTTPQAHDTSGRSLGQKAIHGTKHGCACLVRDAALATWNTPRATDGSNGGPNQAGGALSADAAIAGWPTPTALERNADPETMQKRRDFRKENANQNTVPMYLNEAAQITTDAEMCEAMGYPVTLDGPARLLADGTLLTGFSAGMESGGQLNPRFSGWLMGYPPEWCEAAISCQLATPSRKKAKPTPDAP